MYMREPSDKKSKKKIKKEKVKKAVKLEKKIKTPSQVISQKVVVNIGDKVKAKAKRKPQKKVDKLPPQAVKAPQFIYPTNDLVGQLPQPPPPPPRPPPPPPPRATATAKAQVKAPVKVPDFPSRVLNDQTPSREEILSRKELKAKVEEKEPVVVSKQIETRSLLSDAVDKMVGIKDILKQASTPLEPRPAPAPPPAPPQPQAPPQDKRTQKLLPQGGPRFSNLTPQEVSKKIAEVKEAKKQVSGAAAESPKKEAKKQGSGAAAKSPVKKGGKQVSKAAGKK